MVGSPKGEAETGLITKERYSTLKTQVRRHIVSYVEQHKVKNDVKNSQNWGKNGRVGSLKYNDFYELLYWVSKV